MAQNAAVQAQKSTNVRSLLFAGMRSGVAWLGRTSPNLGAFAAESIFLSPNRHVRPAWEQRILEDAQRFEVTYAGTRLPVWEWGEGPTVLLVHGWEGRGSQLGLFVRPLVARGHRVVALDLPGHGDADSAKVSVVDFARVIAQVHPALGPIYGVIGHSVGGAAATLAYTLSPFAERLVLIGAPRSPRRFFDGFVRYFELDGRTVDAVEHRLAQRYGMPLDDIDVEHFAKFVRAPVLVIHDRADREVPFDHAEAFTSFLPNATLLATEGLGHRRILKDESVIRAATEFVTSPAAVPLSTQLDRELFDRELR